MNELDKNIKETIKRERDAYNASQRSLPTIYVVKGTNSHNKEIVYVADPDMKNNSLVRCPTCGVPNDEFFEFHINPALQTEVLMAEIDAHWLACPWEHPKYVPREETTEAEENSDLTPPFSVKSELSINYPYNHPYHNWCNEHDKLQAKYACPGVKISHACDDSDESIDHIRHDLCNEECYCDCHYTACCCPDLDKRINQNVMMIVCPKHGQVYTKITTEGLV